MFNFFCKKSNMIYHFLPQGTPIYLSIFMVIIEITRIIIRPLTLCIRITANLVAGHVLITLLGNLIIRLVPQALISLSFIPIILSILEIFVSFIQAYVFITLVTLYLTDLK